MHPTPINCQVLSPSSTPLSSRSLSAISQHAAMAISPTAHTLLPPQQPTHSFGSPAPYRNRASSCADEMTSRFEVPIVPHKKLKSHHSSPGGPATQIEKSPLVSASMTTTPTMLPRRGTEGLKLNIDLLESPNGNFPNPTPSPVELSCGNSNFSPSVLPMLPPSMMPTLYSQTPDGRSSSNTFAQWHHSTSPLRTMSHMGFHNVQPTGLPTPTLNKNNEKARRMRPASTLFNSSSNNDELELDDESEEADERGSFADGVYRPLLPTLKSGGQFISCETVMELLKAAANVGNSAYAGLYDKLIIIDARFPYEYQGGHIKGAINLFKEQHVFDYFLTNPPPSMEAGQRICVVFHCEFSQERGPHLFKRLRRRDRAVHGFKNQWSQLFYPEMYIMQGGYKEFFAAYGPTSNSVNSTPVPTSTSTGRITPSSGNQPTPASQRCTWGSVSSNCSSTSMANSSSVHHKESFSSDSLPSNTCTPTLESQPIISRSFSSPSIDSTAESSNGNSPPTGFQSIASRSSVTNSSMMSPVSTTSTPGAAIWANTSSSSAGFVSPTPVAYDPMEGLTIDTTATPQSSGATGGLPLAAAMSPTAQSSRPHVLSRSGEDPSLFLDPPAYTRMRDSRYKAECLVLLRDHESEKKMTRSQSMGALVSEFANGRMTPSPASYVRSLLTPTNGAVNTGGNAAPPQLPSAARNLNELEPQEQLRLSRRRSLSSFHLLTPNSNMSEANANAANNNADANAVLFSPIPSSRSPLISRSYSTGAVGAEHSSPAPFNFNLAALTPGLSPALAPPHSSTPTARTTMVSPSPMLANFHLGSPVLNSNGKPPSTPVLNGASSGSLASPLGSSAMACLNHSPHRNHSPPSFTSLAMAAGSSSSYSSTAVKRQISASSTTTTTVSFSSGQRSWGSLLQLEGAHKLVTTQPVAVQTKSVSPNPFMPGDFTILPPSNCFPTMMQMDRDREFDDASGLASTSELIPPLPPSNPSSRSRTPASCLQELQEEDSDDDHM